MAKEEGEEASNGAKAATAPPAVTTTVVEAVAVVATTTSTNNEDEDPTEIELGITNYLSPRNVGFHAVSKARFSDFLVHEVGIDGKIARLDCIEPKIISDDGNNNNKDDEKEVIEGLDSNKGNDKPENNNEKETCSSETNIPNTSNANEGEESNNNPTTTAGDGDGEGDTTTAGAKRKREQEDASKTIDWSRLEKELRELLVEHDATAKHVIEFFQRGPPLSSSPSSSSQDDVATTAAGSNMDAVAASAASAVVYFVALPPCTDKARRRALHQWIRTSQISNVALADTDNETKAIRIWHKKYETKMPNYKKFGNKNNRNSSSSTRNIHRSKDPNHKYVRFVMYKENMDTGTAIKQLERSFGGGYGYNKRNNNKKQRYYQQQQQRIRVGYSGMKDKRGITAQFVTVPSSKINDLIRYCERQQKQQQQQGGGGGCGHTQSSGAPIMRIGNLEYSSNELSLGNLQGNRFDLCLRNATTAASTSSSIAETRQALETAAEAFRSNGFINYFGVQRFGKFHDTHLTGCEVLKGNYEAAIDIIMRPKPDEREDIKRARNEWLNRFHAATKEEEEKEGGGGKEDQVQQRRCTAERDCAKRVLPQLGRFMNSEISILQCLIDHPCDYKRAFMAISKTMKMMFLHAVQSYVWNHVASFRVSKLGRQVLAGDLVYEDDDDVGVDKDKAASGSSKCMKVHVVTEDELAKYSLEDVVLPLVGKQTTLPSNESGKLFDEVLEKLGLARDVFVNVKDRSLDVSGDYRKLICHPKDFDYEVVEYSDSLQPLLQTDLMTLHGIKTTDQLHKTKSKLIAMNVGFTLPPSSYATIALRELMKKPTSSEFQKVLSVGGDNGNGNSKDESEVHLPSA